MVYLFVLALLGCYLPVYVKVSTCFDIHLKPVQSDLPYVDLTIIDFTSEQHKKVIYGRSYNKNSYFQKTIRYWNEMWSYLKWTNTDLFLW